MKKAEKEPGSAMLSNRHLFLKHVGQTSPTPVSLEIVKAEGCKLWDVDGLEYIDLIGGISVCNVGHRHFKVINAIKEQLDKYCHVMVYGELVQSPQVQYARLLCDHLPSSLNSVFFTTSGSEATEGAMKLAKRYTNRTQVIGFKDSYHGSTQGALSLIGDEYWRNAFRPLLPDVLHLEYNSFEALDLISDRTACVIAETIQAEAGVIVPVPGWLKALKEKCQNTGVLLVLDEIQCGFGRNGTLWAFEQFGIVPDILLLGKAMGGGLPLAAFISDVQIINHLTTNPVLGHINTFGGNPVCCAAGLAAMKVLLDENLIAGISGKRDLFMSLLQHPLIRQVRSAGLMISVEFENYETNKKVIDALLAAGVFADWFLFATNCLRIVPPLIISEEDIILACSRLLSICTSLM